MSPTTKWEPKPQANPMANEALEIARTPETAIHAWRRHLKTLVINLFDHHHLRELP
jgi:hypothetical protein